MLSGSLPENLLLHKADVPFRISQDNYTAVVDACRGCSLIIVDPIIQAARVTDWNAQQEVRDTYELWRRLARELDAVVVTVAHHRKALGDFGEQIAGSIQALATPDGIIEIRRDSSLATCQRRVSYIGREWPDLEDDVIELDPSTLDFCVVGTASDLKEKREQNASEKTADELWKLFPSDPPGVSYNYLIEQSGLGDKPVRNAVRLLKENGKLETTGTARSRPNPLRFHRSEEEDIPI